MSEANQGGGTIRDLLDETPSGEDTKGAAEQQAESYWRNMSRHQTKGFVSRLQTVLAVVLKVIRMSLFIVWQVIGYLFEASMVMLSVLPLFLDCIINCVAAWLGQDARAATEFKMTEAYSKWLNDTYMIAFETVDSRQARSKVKKLDKLHRKQLFEKVVTNGLLKSATSKSLDIRHLDSNASLVFVVTDIEGSTSAQVQSPKAYQGMILIHDCILRDALYAHKGLELDTEGDSFRVAFADPVDALKFCMEVQDALLQIKWPKIMRRIAAFKVVHDKDGNLMFAGPRVRMGVHLADPQEFELTFSHRQKPVISGPGWNSALQMGDVGSGGQIISSAPVLAAVQHNLAEAGFPAVKHLGAYVFDKLPDFSTDIFQVTSSFDSGGMLQRKFPPLRGCAQIARAVPMHGSAMPEGDLALVALRASQYDNLTQQASISSFRIDKSKVNKEDHKAMQVSEQNRELLVLTIDSIAQQFQGCKFSVENQLEEFQFIAFNTVADACRFCIAIQVGLLCADWPLNPQAQFMGNNLIYRGPTLACAIHTVTNSQTGAGFYSRTSAAEHREDQGKEYAGASVGVLQALLGLCNPGQIILGQNAWHGIQYSLGGICQPFVIDQGVHRVSNVGLELGRIMEILPRELKGRVFNDLSSVECIAPGARQSPYVADGVAFVFTSPCLGEETFTSTMEEAVQVFVSATREMLNTKKDAHFFGYECQEVGAGNFMLAFRSLELAITYCKDIMEYLLKYEGWSSDLQKIFPAGLPIKMGVGFGQPYYSMPHPNTGRADYFGPVVNMVARVKQAAKPGQILLALKSKSDPKRKKTHEIISKYSNKGFKLISLGKHNLRGIKGTVALAELEILGRAFGFKEDNNAATTSPSSHTIDISKIPTQAFHTVQDGLARAENYLSK
jgi:class 3 adenylate cyclase